jgi:hypothetical protein
MSNERETRYAEAVALSEGVTPGTDPWHDAAARAVMAVADEEQAADRAEIERLTSERDRAREECGFEKGLKESIRHELGVFIDLKRDAEARLDALESDLRGLPESWARAVHERYCGAPPSCGLSDRSSCEGTAGSDEIRLLRKALRAILDKHAG